MSFTTKEIVFWIKDWLYAPKANTYGIGTKVWSILSERQRQEILDYANEKRVTITIVGDYQ